MQIRFFRIVHASEARDATGAWALVVREYELEISSRCVWVCDYQIVYAQLRAATVTVVLQLFWSLRRDVSGVTPILVSTVWQQCLPPSCFSLPTHIHRNINSLLPVCSDNMAKLRQEKEILLGQVVQAQTESQELRRQANTQVTNINNLTGNLLLPPRVTCILILYLHVLSPWCHGVSLYLDSLLCIWAVLCI